METKRIKQSVKPEKPNNVPVNKTKSRTALFREKYPEGIGEIVNMRAVLR